MIDLPIAQDTGWQFDPTYSIPNRGIRDYTRRIECSRELTDDELESLRSALEQDEKCPGWTGVTCRKEGSTCVFSTTYDSSD